MRDRNRLRLLLVAGFLVAAAGLVACSDDEVTGPTGDPSPYARALTHPDSLIGDLVQSYGRREIAPYANLLAKDFEFHFLPEDAAGIPNGTWFHAADSTGTYNLFNDPEVTRITVSLLWFPPVADTLRGQTTQRVDVTFTDLKVDIDGGNTTLHVNGDRQVFHFVAGRAGLGEDPGRLYLFDWRDLGQPGPLAVTEQITWGRIKRLGSR